MKKNKYAKKSKLSKILHIIWKIGLILLASAGTGLLCMLTQDINPTLPWIICCVAVLTVIECI